MLSALGRPLLKKKIDNKEEDKGNSNEIISLFGNCTSGRFDFKKYENLYLKDHVLLRKLEYV